MGQNYYSETNLHITWHCKESAQMLTPQIEPVAHRIIWERLVNTHNAFVHEIGGTETHLHLAITVPPSLTISDLVGQLKGASSHDVNQHFSLRGKVLQWQAGYGVVTFGTKDLPWVKQYIRNQRQHHAAGKTGDRLERIAEAAPGINAGPITGWSRGTSVNARQ
jgi:putative transposase